MKLVEFESSKTGNPIYVNPRHVVAVEGAGEDTSRISTRDSRNVTVHGWVHEVSFKLENEPRMVWLETGEVIDQNTILRIDDLGDGRSRIVWLGFIEDEPMIVEIPRESLCRQLTANAVHLAQSR